MDLFKSKIFPIFSRVRKVLSDSLFFVGNIFNRKKKPSVIIDNTMLDKKLVYSLSKSKLPNLRQLKYLSRTLSSKELWLIRFSVFLIFLSAVWMGFGQIKDHLKTAPIAGGQYTEGLVGKPLRLNPLYSSLNEVDADISRLIYSSLFKYDENGQLVKDLVEDYQISDDGRTYTFKLRSDARWDNGENLTADDVIFTFEAINNPAYNSPLRPSFNGVDMVKQDDNTVVATLSQKYAPFLSALTFGILPESLWSQIDPQSAPLAELNLKPVGSGPYKFESLVKDKSGDIKSYALAANKYYYGKKPYLKKVTFKFYLDRSEAVSALNSNSVDGLNSLAPGENDQLIAKNSLNFNLLALPRIKAIFLNQEKNSLLKDVKVRQALALATPRQEIVDSALSGEAKPAYGPIIESSFAYNKAIERYDFDLARAASLLESAGWKKVTITQEQISELAEKQKNSTSTAALTDDEKKIVELGAGAWLSHEVALPKTTKTKNTSSKTAKVATSTAKNYLTITLTVIDNDEDAKISDLIKSNWEKIGVKVTVVRVPVKEILAEAVKPRSYQALLFTEMVGSDPDVYFFWHSSQATAGGYNLSNYRSEEADKMLEDGRVATSSEERAVDYQKFQEIVANDCPAIFLYSPYYIYPQNKKIKGFAVKNINSSSDRFAGVSGWYEKTGQKIEW